MIEFNKKNFWSAIIMMALIFLGSWLLGIIFHPILVSSILAMLIVVWKSGTIWSGIKHYWNMLMNIIFKNK